MTDITSMNTPPSDLEAAFRLPLILQDDPMYVGIYNDMMERLQREASGVPMTTLQKLLMERITSLYVTIRWREDNDTWRGVSQQKEFNTYWLDLTKEFNRLLTNNEDQLRDELLRQVQQVVNDAVGQIPDDKIKQNVRKRLATGFREIQL